ncbi:hypothetical protein ACM64Y_00050 [Novispirillum sp. DQ9]|uniref:hypothetical protein n=1 Tax=Novispirillum sp. DQ9 TaxID=3398612 RepID=UPI003C7A4102
MNDSRHDAGGPWPAPKPDPREAVGQGAGQGRRPDQPAPDQPTGAVNSSGAPGAPGCPPQGRAGGEAGAAAPSPKRRWRELDPEHDAKPTDRRELLVWNRRADLIKAEERMAAARRALDEAIEALTDYRLGKHKDVLATVVVKATEAGVDVENVLEMMRLASERPGGLKGVVEQLRRSPGCGS